MKHFKFYSKEDILSMTRVRRFETRMGERVRFLKPDSEWPEVLKESDARYVILGIPEDFGVKANYGVGGTETLALQVTHQPSCFLPLHYKQPKGHIFFVCLNRL